MVGALSPARVTCLPRSQIYGPALTRAFLALERSPYAPVWIISKSNNRQGGRFMGDRTARRSGTPERHLTGVLGRRSRLVRLSVGIVALVVCGLLLNYAMYGEWPWTAYPSALKMCGRDFQKEGAPETRKQLESLHHEMLVRIGDMPGWFNRGDLWAYRDEQPFSSDCRVVMMVRDGDHFQTYDLIGGP